MIWTAEQVYEQFLPLILVLVMAEVAVSVFFNRSWYKLHDTLSSLAMLAGNLVVNIGVKALTIALYLFLYPYRIFDWFSLVPLWLAVMLTFLAMDLTFYWFHRASHRTRFLWAVHLSHHSSEEMNFIVALRQPWLGPVVRLPFFLVLPLLGFEPLLLIAVGVASTLWGVIGHTQWIGRLGVLDRFLNTPSTHRVHHGSNEKYLDKNYGNLLIIWDRMFGTYQAEEEPVVYGLVENVNTFNPLTITIMGWKRLWRDMQRAPDLRSSLRRAFAPPNDA